MYKGFVEFSRPLRPTGIDLDFYARIAKSREARAAYGWIRVVHRRDYFANTGGEYGVDARRGTAQVRARLERQEKRRSVGTRSRLFNRQNLGVFYPCIGVKATPDNVAIADHDCTDRRIRRSAAYSARGKFKRFI